ncbi:hypothetical protein FQN52_004187 [Onygenales sp. PD_12]|nr:hypothetical protein FQN52_004187 [Onygenales sp. PD_12]
MPIPPVFDVDERIRELEEARDPNSPFCEREEFWPNIPTLIKLYKEGKMPDPNVKPTYLRDGKVITEEEYRADPSWAWKEVRFYYLHFLFPKICSVKYNYDIMSISSNMHVSPGLQIELGS